MMCKNPALSYLNYARRLIAQSRVSYATEPQGLLARMKENILNFVSRVALSVVKQGVPDLRKIRRM